MMTPNTPSPENKTLSVPHCVRIVMVLTLLLISQFAAAADIQIAPGRQVDPRAAEAQRLTDVVIEPGKQAARALDLPEPSTAVGRTGNDQAIVAAVAQDTAETLTPVEDLVVEHMPPEHHFNATMQHGVLIVPGRILNLAHTASCGCHDCCGSKLALAQEYKQVYDSIPFSRAEYDSNRSYRHDATMEILIGELREQNIQNITIRNSQAGNYGFRPFWPYNSSVYYRSPLGWNRTHLHSLPGNSYGVPGYGFSNNWIY